MGILTPLERREVEFRSKNLFEFPNAWLLSVVK